MDDKERNNSNSDHVVLKRRRRRQRQSQNVELISNDTTHQHYHQHQHHQSHHHMITLRSILLIVLSICLLILPALGDEEINATIAAATTTLGEGNETFYPVGVEDGGNGETSSQPTDGGDSTMTSDEVIDADGGAGGAVELPKPLEISSQPQLSGQHFKITVLQEGSFLEVHDSNPNNPNNNVVTFGGYLIDVLESLAKPNRANFTYELRTPSGYGAACSPRLDPYIGVSSPIRRPLPYDKVFRTQYNCGAADVNDRPMSNHTTDMYLGLYYITPSRQQLNQFTIPYMPPTRGTLAMYGTATNIETFNDLRDQQQQPGGLQRLATCAPGGTALIEFIRKSYPGLVVTDVFGGDDDIDQAFEDGTCTVYITDAPLVTQFVLQRSKQDKCIFRGKPIGLIGEPMEFGLSHYGIGIRSDISDEVTNTLSYWMNVLMSCNSKDPEGECPDGNFADFYAGRGGTGLECNYVASPKRFSASEAGLQPLGVVGIVFASVVIAVLILRWWNQIKLRRQAKRINLLETYRKRLGLLDKVAEVQREYLESNDASVVYSTLLEGILELMDSQYGFIGEIKYSNADNNNTERGASRRSSRDSASVNSSARSLQREGGTPYLHVHASVDNPDDPCFQGLSSGDMRFYDMNSLFGRVLLTKKPIVSNNIRAEYALNDYNVLIRTDEHSVNASRKSAAKFTSTSTTEKPMSSNSMYGGGGGGNGQLGGILNLNGGVPTPTTTAFPQSKSLKSFLGIPFVSKGGEISGMIAIANKKGGYSTKDVDFLEPFSATVTNLIQAFWQIAKNEHLINTLEQTVRERTNKLSVANVELAEANKRVLKASAAQLKHFACMSHEIRTPLNCIIGLSSMLLETELAPSQKEEVRMIVTSGDLLLTVVNDVLDYAKLESGNVEINIKECNFQDTLNAVVHSIESKGRSKNLKILKLYDIALPQTMTMDGRRVQQILYNLLGNAIKFSKDDGVVELLVSLEADTSGSEFGYRIQEEEKGQDIEMGERSITNGSLSSPSIIRFSVKDYGKGIEKKDFAKIFKPFSQATAETESVYGGTGLGLAISNKLVHALGGNIAVDSVVEKWTEFTVTFPFKDTPVNVGNIVKRLSNVHIFFVTEDLDLASHVFGVFKAFSVKFSRHSNLNEIDDMIKSGTLPVGKTTIVLINEEIYDARTYSRVKLGLRRPVLFTYGTTFKVKEAEDNFRDLTHIFPSALMERLLPRSAQEMDSFKRSSLYNLPKQSFSALRVLIAEDNLINQKVLTRLLKRVQIEDVTVVDDGAKAVESELNDIYDVVFLDYQMPIMDGVTACRHISKRYRDNLIQKPKIVFVTAHASANFENECFEAGCDGFLPKPFSIRGVEECLGTLFSA